MAIWDKWIVSLLTRLDYPRKADISQGVGLGTVLGGETPIGSELSLGSTWTTEQAERLAITCPWVFRDISVLSQTLSSIPFGVHEKAGEKLEPIESHPFEILFEWPNEFMDQSWLLEYSGWWYWLRGETYWMLVPDNAGELAEIWPIPSSRMRPIPDAKEYIRGFAYAPTHGGQAEFLASENVCFVRRPNPFDFHRGLSPLSAYRLDMEGDIQAARWNLDAYKEGLALRMILSVPQETTTTTFEVIKADLRDELIERKRRMLIIRAGDVKAEEYGLTHEDAEYLASREFTAKEIDGIFGIPEGFWSVKANRANADAAKATFYEHALWPVAVRFAGAITGQVLRPYYGESLRGKFEDVRPRDREMIVKERRLNWTGFSFDEVRADLGKEPFPDALIGEMPYVHVVRGGAQAGGGMELLGNPLDEKATRDDLRRWRSVALRLFRNGGDYGGYDFESGHISEQEQSRIKSALRGAGTEEEIKAAFAAGFPESDAWAAYP